ncbi:MAG TPA: murein L,D-transpeptidase catalytic domain family protein [Chitinophagaceae bacterium]|nr:murein L,D-transpeptidase catalytic domain family protein [Chitinophagaceae bacterium]
MRNLLLPISMGLLCTSFTILPTPKTVSNSDAVVVSSHHTGTTSAGDIICITSELEQCGLSKEVFDNAWKGYQYLLGKNKITRSAYLTICDFSQSSKQKRLYIIDVEKNELVMNTYVAHGKNSGAEYATYFSNRPESLQSSLGFYVTANTYIGEHGLSLRIEGVEPGINDKAMERTIVIHGAAYVDAARVKAGMYMGRSWGCPAVPQKESQKIISTIKNGTCLFIWHPSRNYLLNSKILNG